MSVRFPSGKLARSTLWTGAVLGGRIAIQALGLLLLVRLFDPSVYGRIAPAATLAVLMGVLPTLGAGFLLLARAPRDPNAAADVWCYAWPLSIVLGGGLGLLYIVLGTVTGGTHALPFSVLATFAATELMVMPLIGLASFVMQSRDQVPLSQVLQSLPFALRALAIVPCFYLPPDERILPFALFQLLASVIALAASLRIVGTYIPLGGEIRLPTRLEIREGATWAGTHLVAANATEIDKVFALRLIGAHDTGLYAIASRVLIALMMPINALLLSVQMRLFGHAHIPSKQGRRLIKVVIFLAGAWGIAAGVLLWILSLFVQPVLGSAYAEAAPVMAWMAWVAPIMGLRFAAGWVLMAIGGGVDRLIFELVGILVVIGALLLLTPVWQVFGIVIAVGLAESMMLVLGAAMVSRRLRALDGRDGAQPATY